jgi:hypothetical protein
VSTVSEALLEHPVRDDARARCLLERAQGTLQKWPEGFIGFAATIRCRDGGHQAEGDVHVFTGQEYRLRVTRADKLILRFIFWERERRT